MARELAIGDAGGISVKDAYEGKPWSGYQFEIFNRTIARIEKADKGYLIWFVSEIEPMVARANWSLWYERCKENQTQLV